MTAIINGSSPSITFSDSTTQATAFTGSASLLTSGTLPTARLPSGTVLKVQQYYDNGTTTTSSSLVGLQGSRFSYTPVSTNSKLYFIHSAYTYINPTAGYPAGGGYVFWYLAEYNGSSDVVVSSANYLWNYQYSSTYGQSIATQSTFQISLSNSSTATRQFNTLGASAYGSPFVLGCVQIYLTIIEVAN